MLKIIFLYLVLYNLQISSSIIIIQKPATTDLDALTKLDRKVCYEYFKPLYQQYYAHYSFGMDPDTRLEQDILEDKEMFAHCIEENGKYQLLAAFDSIANTIVGLLVFYKKDAESLELELLIIDSEYRKQGIGKRLIMEAIKKCDRIKTCNSYVFTFNESAKKFYESLGFINLGKGEIDRMSDYGISYAELFYHYRLLV